MYNLLITANPAAWEGEEFEFKLDRFYGGTLEPEGAATGQGGDVKRETFKRLIGLPTILMYENGTRGGAGQIVRYGRITSLELYGTVLSFTFEPDLNHGYLTQEQVMAFGDHLALGRASHTHWALKGGNIPPALIRLGVATAPQRTLGELEEEMAKAEAMDDRLFMEAVRRQRARLERHSVEPRAASGVVAETEDALGPPKSVVAFIVGLEEYHKLNGAGLSKVNYAATDAQQFAQTLREIYGDALEKPTIYLNGEATQSTIKNELAVTIRRLGPDDLFIFYYAGHGFHGPDGNRLSAADTSYFNRQDTSLSIREILVDPLVNNHQARRALAFIDACAEHLPKDGRSALANLDPKELQAFLTTANYSAVFLSCQPGEQSWSTGVIKNGIWTYHLIKALKGEAAQAIGPGGYITDASLKDYLAVAVPAFIRDHTTITAEQTPQAAITATKTFAICKIEDVAEAAPSTLTELGLTMRSQHLEGRLYGSLKRLPGWNSNLRIPDRDNATTRSFVEGFLAPVISDDLQGFYLKTKEVFDLSHRAITKEESGASGSLHTDAFRYSIQASLDPDDLSRHETIHRLELRRTDSDTLAKLDAVFGLRFQALVGVLDDHNVEFDDVVDVVESLKKRLGGACVDDSRTRLATYTAPGGDELAIDLDNGEVRLEHFTRAKPSVIVAAAMALNRTVSDAVALTQPPAAVPKQ